MAISVEFQKRFIDLMEYEDCKKSELVKRIGISDAILAKIVNYGIVPMPKVLARIADYFETSVDYMLGRTKDETFSKSGNPASFQERLNELKDTQNLTSYELSKKALIPKDYFSIWKTKGYLPSLEYLETLANYFGTSIDYLLGRTDDK